MLFCGTKLLDKDMFSVSLEERRSFINIAEQLKIDRRTRHVSALGLFFLFAWVLSWSFALLWCSLIIANESFEFALTRRIQKRKKVSSRGYYVFLTNLFCGTCIWTFAVITLWASGQHANMILGLCVLIGLMTHSAFHYTDSARVVSVTMAAPVLTLIALPFLPITSFDHSMREFMILAIAFSILVFYFVSATIHNLQTKQSLNDSITKLSEAQSELEEHKSSLSDLVVFRTLELEEKKLELEESLNQERRAMEYQNQFVSVVCHEFRTPLAIIDGSARRTQKTVAKGRLEKIDERAETIRDAVVRMTTLMERLLDASRIMDGSLDLNNETFDVCAQVETCIQRAIEAAPNHQFKVTFGERVEHFMGDPKLLDSVFYNIISNAIKYSKQNPLVFIDTGVCNGMFVFQCRDKGVGIPKEELPQIADRFFRASSAKDIKGTGIGLNLVRRIVEQHGGEFAVDSELGAWTEVTVSLPIGDADILTDLSNVA